MASERCEWIVWSKVLGSDVGSFGCFALEICRLALDSTEARWSVTVPQRYPQALLDLAAPLFQGYAAARQQANVNPDPELLAQATRILGSGPGGTREPG